MENNELMNNEEFIELEEVDCEIYDEESEGSAIGAAIGVGVATAILAVGGVIAYKCRHKIEAWNVNRLKKKGYVIYNPNDMEDVDEVCAKDVK